MCKISSFLISKLKKKKKNLGLYWNQENNRNIDKWGENKINLKPNSKFKIQIQLVLLSQRKN